MHLSPDKSLWNPRAQAVLYVLIKQYIRVGRLVGAVRNVMADFESSGCVLSGTGS